jgi:hypothetical protein
MRKKIKRTRRLLEVQRKLLSTDRLELAVLRDSLVQAKEDEAQVLSFLNSDRSALIPPQFLVRRVASSTIRIRDCEKLLQAQTEKTLDQARKEQLVKKKLDSENIMLSREDLKQALQITIDAYLSSSVKQG